MTRSAHTPRRLLALAVPAILLVSACGGDDDGSDDTAADVTDAPEDTGGTATTEASTETTTESGTEPTTADVEGFEFTSPDGDYTAVFPSEPQTMEQNAPTADGGEIPMTIHIAELDDAGYTVAEFTVPDGVPYSIDAGREGAIQGVGGEAVSDEDIEYQGREGTEFVASVESNGISGTYVSRILVDDDRVYQIAVVAEGELTADDEQVATFLDSLQFTS